MSGALLVILSQAGRLKRNSLHAGRQNRAAPHLLCSAAFLSKTVCRVGALTA